MRIRLVANVADALAGLMEAETRQAPYFVSLWLNRLANDAQAAIQAHMGQAFNLRRGAFVLRGIYIAREDRATRTSWRVVLQVQEARNFLAKFEPGGFRLPIAGRHHLAVPNPKVFRGIISADDPLRPSRLQLRKTPGGEWRGREGTFLVRMSSGESAILQRIGRDATGKRRRGVIRTRGRRRGDAVRVLYFLKSRVKVPAKLEFIATATQAIDRNYTPRFREAYDKAMGSAR